MTEALQEVKVVYCGKCGMPPEYCHFGPDFESHCDPWLSKNQPVLHAKLKATRTHAPKNAAADDAEGEGVIADDRPTKPWTIEERLAAFYEKYQPDKVGDVPQLLEKYAGKEDKLFVALIKKYGPEPEDPYYADDSDSDDDDDDDDEDTLGMDNLNVGGKKRRGVAAKKADIVETRVVIQKIQQKKKKTTTIVVGMETVPGMKLKDAAKAFSKRFAGSSSVKDAAKGKEIIIQGDHMENVAEMLVSKFQVPASSIFLDVEGEFMAFG
jgi:density-regulated protein DRP1